MYPAGKFSSQTSGLSSQVDVQVIVTEAGDGDVDKVEYQRPAYVAVALIMALTVISVLFPAMLTSSLFGLSAMYDTDYKQCTETCIMSMVESIPENLTYPTGSVLHLSTYHAWKNLLLMANQTLDIASFYWTLRGADIYPDPSDWQGEDIFKELMAAGTMRGIKIRIVQSVPSGVSDDQDTKDLVKQGAAEVRTLNMTRLVGGGILHTKLWIVDGKHFYVGSANMDWRSLTQVKELGTVVYNCSCLAQDVSKIFEAYWYLAQENATIPDPWPAQFMTKYNNDTPLQMMINNTNAEVYLSSSPPPLCPRGRTTDIAAILDVIARADEFIYVSVMDYSPTTEFTPHRMFWPEIDDALRAAAIERKIKVRFLPSYWNNTKPDMLHYIRSLSDINGVRGVDLKVRLFEVPAFTPAQAKIPFARVNHNKYMVTDNAAYIGTSNWSGDYFINTGGIGLIVNQTNMANETSYIPLKGSKSKEIIESATIQLQLKAIFERDWNSDYSRPLSEVLHKVRRERL